MRFRKTGRPGDFHYFFLQCLTAFYACDLGKLRPLPEEKRRGFLKESGSRATRYFPSSSFARTDFPHSPCRKKGKRKSKSVALGEMGVRTQHRELFSPPLPPYPTHLKDLPNVSPSVPKPSLPSWRSAGRHQARSLALFPLSFALKPCKMPQWREGKRGFFSYPHGWGRKRNSMGSFPPLPPPSVRYIPPTKPREVEREADRGGKRKRDLA